MSSRTLRGYNMSGRRTNSRPTSDVPLNIYNRSLDDGPSVLPWQRNPSWLTLPTVLSTDQKFVGLYRVDASNSYVALTAAGNYTVNWGDGTSENVNTGVTAYHLYDYADADLANTNAPVTFTSSTSTVNRTAHGYTNGSSVRFFNIVTTTGISEGARYYVINATANTFQVTPVMGDVGSIITLTGDGSATLLEYKQAIIVVTPQAGQNLTSVDLNVRHTSQPTGTSDGWLDINVSSPNLTALAIGSSAVGVRTGKHNHLEQVSITNSGTITSMSFLLSALEALQSCPVLDTTGVTNMASMFDGCLSLELAPSMDTSSVTTVNEMFMSCWHLRTVPLYNFSSLVDMSYMFWECVSLLEIPLFNTSSVTNMSFTFWECYALETIPLLNTVNVTNFSYTFQYCRSLKCVPLFNTGSATTMDSMFWGCSSLESVPRFNTSNVTNMWGMFGDCRSLENIPPFDTHFVQTFQSMFSGCESLRTIPTLNTSSGTTMASMFSGCTSLREVPLLDTTAVTSMAGMFTSCWALRSVPRFNTANVTNFSNMFYQCYGLRFVPTLNTTNATNTIAMFSRTYNIHEVPWMDTSKVTTFDQMFQSCGAYSVPALNTSAGISFSGMFQYAASITTIPPLNMNGATGATAVSNAFNNTPSLKNINAYNIRSSTTIPASFTPANVPLLFSNLGAVVSNATLSFSPGYVSAAFPKVLVTGSVTAGSTTLTTADTTGVTAGMYVLGYGAPLTTPISVTFTDAGDLVNLTAHGLVNGDPVSFATIVTTTGITINTTYYVVNAATDTFQVAATIGGAALPLTSNGSGTVRYVATVVSVIPNTSITLSRKATATLSTQFSLAPTGFEVWIPSLKGFAVTW